MGSPMVKYAPCVRCHKAAVTSKFDRVLYKCETCGLGPFCNMCLQKHRSETRLTHHIVKLYDTYLRVINNKGKTLRF
jgi:hypothetical protein